MITLYNTLGGKKEEFKPSNSNSVSMYTCGPTVYDTPHIGNYRTFLMNDFLRRILELNGYKVEHVMNITDVDDKTIRRSREEKIPLSELTRKYEELFLDELDSLNVKRPTKLTRATEYIKDMIDIVSVLLEKEVAYKADDGVYMRINKVQDYGKLAKLKSDNSSKERISNDEYDKESPSDFALWKFKTIDDGEVSYPAPFGEGRPGWHIECSAMSIKNLGETIDIHTGGTDLIFPHHTNEIAQSECYTGKQFVRYWIHGGFMNVSDEKMSKSKKNFFKLSDLADESISPLTFRYWLMTAHYRSQINFTYEALHSAQTALIKLMSRISTIPEQGKVNEEYKNRFISFVNDDMDMPKAIALTWDLMKDKNVSSADKKATAMFFDQVFGLKLDKVPTQKPVEILTEVIALADFRKQARIEKDWEKADALRDEINSRGFDIVDKNDNSYEIVQI